MFRIFHFREGDNMKKLWIGIYLIPLCLGLSFSASWAQEAIGPRMVLEEKTFELKEVDEGKTVVHTFTVLNTGDQPLVIKRVKPG